MVAHTEDTKPTEKIPHAKTRSRNENIFDAIYGIYKIGKHFKW